MTEMKMSPVRGARLVVAVVAALFFAVAAPVLLMHGAAALLVAGAVVVALLAGIDAMVSADRMLNVPSTAPSNPADAHTLAA